jgi:vacuolar-type H+-ATPase subunit I/STV1
MTLYQLTVPKDDSWDVMNQLGALDLAHFINLNKGEQPFNLPYASQIKRCEETERRILYIMNQCKGMGVDIKKPKDVAHFLENLEKLRVTKKKATNLLFEEIESDIIQKERFVIDQMERLKEMGDGYITMIDYKNVLEKVAEIIPKVQGGNDIRASMHGGLTVKQNQYRTSLNQDEESV